MCRWCSAVGLETLPVRRDNGSASTMEGYLSQVQRECVPDPEMVSCRVSCPHRNGVRFALMAKMVLQASVFVNQEQALASYPQCATRA